MLISVTYNAYGIVRKVMEILKNISNSKNDIQCTNKLIYGRHACTFKTPNVHTRAINTSTCTCHGNTHVYISFQAYDWWLNDMYMKPRFSLPLNSNPGMVFPRQNFEDQDAQLR